MFYIKLAILKVIDILARLKGGGSSFSGYFSIKFNYNLIEKIDLFDTKVIFVIGTNGKTTTANMITESLSYKNKVVSNTEGANLLEGIFTVIYRNVKFNKKVDCDYLVLEVDEKTVSQIIKYIKPDDVVITNFFRDQLDRYGEIDTIVAQIINCIDDPNIEVHLNGCDPLINYKFRNNKNKISYYGLDKTSKSNLTQSKIVELKYCPDCLKKLNYDYYHYGHIGHYNCECGFKQNKLETNLKVDFINDVLTINDNNISITTNKFPLYYYFNVASCVSLIKKYDADYLNHITEILNNFKFPKGRSQVFKQNDRRIYLNLVKNVVGFEETIDYINQEFSGCSLLILFNDNYADGRDVSWIWDTHILELIKNIDHLYIAGTRRYDMAMRFEFENMTNISIIDLNIEEACDSVLLSTNSDLAIISNYTPLEACVKSVNKFVGVK